MTTSDEVEGAVSAALRRTVRDLGADAERWLADLPALVAETLTAWNLRPERALRHGGAASVIFFVTTDRGEPAVLKLSVPHEESRYEAEALRHWSDHGAVSVRRSSTDGFVLLLERCEPGHDLWRLDIDGQIEVISDLLPRLWTPVSDDAPFRLLAEVAADWARRMEQKAAALDLPREVTDRARRWAEELADHRPRRLLHGDLNPGNVLATQRQPWLAIDPKPLVGDPAFDLAQVLANWVFVDVAAVQAPAETIRIRASALADRLGLDLGVVLRWAAVKAIAWGFGRDQALVLDEAARTT